MQKALNKMKDIVFHCFNYVFYTVFGLMCVYPFYYILMYSLSNPQRADAKGVTLLPVGFTLQNYIAVFRLQNIERAFFISTVRTVVGTIITVLCSSVLAYLVTKKELPFRKIIYRYLVISMYFSGGLIPWYILMKFLGLKNNFLLYVIPGAIAVYFVILVKTFIEQLPASFEESAMIDGAGYFTIFTKIIFPLCLPIVATISVFNAVGQWNAWTDNFFLASIPKLQTLQLVLLKFLHENEAFSMATDFEVEKLAEVKITPKSIRMTITMVATIPIILVYPYLQKFFIKGIMMGAIKG